MRYFGTRAWQCRKRQDGSFLPSAPKPDRPGGGQASPDDRSAKEQLRQANRNRVANGLFEGKFS